MNKKAEKLVEKLLEDTTGQSNVPVDDVIEWTPSLFDEYAYASSGTPVPPDEFFEAIESGPIDDATAGRLSDWLNSNWEEICNCDVDGEKCPDSWRGMKWTPELAKKMAANVGL